MEIINPNLQKKAVRAVVFDWDGTISTLRHDWESLMGPMMIELIGKDSEQMVRDYINESAGIQTIFQMKWLAEQVKERYGTAEDPWIYKTEYNRRLMENVTRRRADLKSGVVSREDYLISGSEALLKALTSRGITLYAASGTDDPDVKTDAAALGMDHYFNRIVGAPPGIEDCSKEKILRELLGTETNGEELAVVGDGKVEIRLGREAGIRTLGVASDEVSRSGINPVKYDRLYNAGADAITGDFLDLNAIIRFFTGEL